MSGHSKWSKIKHAKTATDAKRSEIFSKMAKLISIAAKKGEDPSMNASLRLAIEKAKSFNMPKDKIENAIKKDKSAQLEEVTYEAYGPNGTPLIIEAITDNKNRTVSEIKHILSRYNGKLAETGSVKYLFSKQEGEWKPNYTTEPDENLKNQLLKLFEALDDHDDINDIYSNVNL
ncbi:YebC/PmpR family DNA-binding transcriptional regulator [Patescibacteria group bacterium]|nr:YebC/PmpR family DNA-binding transcriptional regulator [Patescibacteria group bacterium]